MYMYIYCTRRPTYKFPQTVMVSHIEFYGNFIVSLCFVLFCMDFLEQFLYNRLVIRTGIAPSSGYKCCGSGSPGPCHRLYLVL